MHTLLDSSTRKWVRTPQHELVETLMTELVEDANVMLKDRNGIEGEELTHSIVQQSALKRIGKPEEVASVVSFLASEDSGFVSGRSP